MIVHGHDVRLRDVEAVGCCFERRLLGVRKRVALISRSRVVAIVGMFSKRVQASDVPVGLADDESSFR
mgnify:CR=1 FL=1